MADVKAESLYFESFLKEYNENPRTALMSRYNAVLAEVLGGIDQKFVFGARNGGKLWLKLGPEIPKAAEASQPETSQPAAAGTTPAAGGKQ